MLIIALARNYKVTFVECFGINFIKVQNVLIIVSVLIKRVNLKTANVTVQIHENRESFCTAHIVQILRFTCFSVVFFFRF